MPSPTTAITPLHWAAYKDASSVAQVLLSNGAAVDAKSNDGRTPLHLAAGADGSSVAQVLLSNGAAVDAKDNNGWTPLHERRLWMVRLLLRSCCPMERLSTPRTTTAWTPLQLASLRMLQRRPQCCAVTVAEGEIIGDAMSEAQHPLNALPRGYRLREYELVRVLGLGGFGMTYLGFDHNLDKAVAIKEYLPSDIATRIADRSVSPQASDFHDDFQWGLERFLDEARTLARFDHRHIIKVHRFFEAHGTAYIVMEYAEGETLSAYLTSKGTLSEAELKGILYPLLDALAVIHRADFLHRDIKPGNIVLRDENGAPVLLDFGSARQAIGAKSRSVTSIVTPGYAPIEQYSSRGRQGAWTDIYALGGVCYRALTGQVPDDATDRLRDDPLVPVSQRCAGRVSGAFLSAIDGALSVDEGDRPQSIGAWREVMEGKAGEAQERARDSEEAPKDAAGDATIVGRVEPAAPPSEPQKKTEFKLLFAVVLGVVALLVGRQMYIDHAEQVALEKQRQEQAVEKARLAAEQAEKERREQAALEKQRQEQEQAFVAAVGRMPHPGGMNKGETDLHTAARLNLPVLALSLLNQGGQRRRQGQQRLDAAAPGGVH